MRNYLTRLGWAHGDDEFFTSAQAMEWFDLSGIGRAPARLDFKKLENICGQHMAASDDAALLHEWQAFRAASGQDPLTPAQRDLMSRGLYCVKDRAKTFLELTDKARFMMVSRPVPVDDQAAKALDPVSRGILSDLTPRLQTAQWTKDALEVILTDVATAHGIGFGKLAGPLRAAIAGRTVTPSVYDMMLVIGRDETISRIRDAAA
jgi:glutamyl-tRNA synthetase